MNSIIIHYYQGLIYSCNPGTKKKCLTVKLKLIREIYIKAYKYKKTKVRNDKTFTM